MTMVTIGDINKKVSETEKKYDAKIKDIEKKYEERFKQLENTFDEKLNDVKKELETKITHQTGQIDLLSKLLEQKDEVIGRLNKELGCLETKIKTVDRNSEECHLRVSEQINKTADLEDRSRRQNIIFYNVPEADNETIYECEKSLISVIEKNNLLHTPGNEEPVDIDRAHRLGKKNIDRNTPRPLIAKFTFYKDKEAIIGNGRKLKDTGISMVQDYSKHTASIHKQIYNAAKEAQKKCGYIVRFYMKYKYVTLVYKTKGDGNLIRRNYNLGRIVDNPHGWYKLQGF